MKIQLKKELRGQFQEITVERGITIEEIYRSLEEKPPYTVLAARVNNKIERLGHHIYSDCRVELLDMRTQEANLIYQNSLCLIYLKAIEDVLGNVEVDIENSLNKGLYTEIKSQTPVTAKEVREIQQRMSQLVKADIPFVREKISKEDAEKIFAETGCPEKVELLCENQHMRKIPFYSLKGYRDFFYGLMVPSTGYIQYFQLMKYKRGVLLQNAYFV